MKVSQIYASNNDKQFLKAADLSLGTMKLTIASARQDNLGGKQKIILAFSDDDRELVVNATNGAILAKLYGDDTDAWIGKQITLAKTQVKFKGQLVDGITVLS